MNIASPRSSLQSHSETLAMHPLGAPEARTPLGSGSTASLSSAGETDDFLPDEEQFSIDIPLVLAADLEAQMAQGRASRRADQLRIDGSAVLRLPRQVREKAHRCGQSTLAHLNRQRCTYITLSIVGGILTGVGILFAHLPPAQHAPSEELPANATSQTTLALASRAAATLAASWSP